ncbi:PucR family transcriptional regulator [Kitasatospora nipponensis]|uniref:PucR family transcriptional regulator n=1 Tax=Kitasatospora nipponensis TaxID=258049 RepID=UPI003CD05625
MARSAGRGPGLYLLDDVLLEYQLSRPSPARDRLAALLAPLARRPELLDTLRTFLACGLDRRQAAARLQVHPNTVDYRLRRATELTGLDAARGADQLTLRAALAARDTLHHPDHATT